MGTVRADACRDIGAPIVALYDTDPAVAAALASAHHGSRVVGSVEEIPWPEVDAAIVCTPPGARAEGVVAAVRAGVPVLMEKPVGSAADAIAAALDECPVITAVGYMNRYRPSVIAVRERLAGERVLGITCHWSAPPYRRSWWGAESTGPLDDYATHLVDLCRFLAGEVRDVRAFGRGAGVFRTGTAILDFESGACGALLYSSEGTEKQIAVDVFSTQGHVRLEGWDLVAAGEAGTHGHDPFAAETRAFLAAVADSAAECVLCDFHDARRTQAVIDAIARAIPSASE